MLLEPELRELRLLIGRVRTTDECCCWSVTSHSQTASLESCCSLVAT